MHRAANDRYPPKPTDAAQFINVVEGLVADGRQLWPGDGTLPTTMPACIAKPALTPDQVKAIRTVLELKAPVRDQLLFSIAIDGSLRGRDLVRLKVSDVAIDGEPRGLVRVRPSASL